MNKAPLILVAISLIVGIVAGDALSSLVPLWLWLAMAVAVFLVALALGRCKGSLGISGQIVAALLSILAIGATLIRYTEQRQQRPMPSGPIVYRAVISSEPQVKGKVLRCDLLITDGPWQRPVKVRAAILRDTVANRWQTLHVGDGIEAWSVMEPLRNFRRSNFDYVRWQRVHGYSFNTFIYYRNWRKARVSLLPLSRLDRIRLRMLRLRHRLLERYQMLGLDEQQYAVVAAMTLGDKSALSKEVKDNYSVTGGSHVLALSGLHLSIIYALLTMLFFGRSRRTRWVSQTLILLAIWMYVLLVGMMPSVVRSATMLTLFSLCLLLDRHRQSLSAIALAAIIMLIASPMTLWDVGFQMSFMAVLAIAVCYPTLYHCFHSQHAVVRWLWGMACISLVTQLGTAPLVAYYFERFSCYFLLTNFIVVPAATLILYGTVAMLLATPFLPLQSLIAKGLAALAACLNSVLAAIAAWPGASIEGIHLSLLQLYLCYVVIATAISIIAIARPVKDFHRLDAFQQ